MGGGKSFRAGLESSYGDALQMYYNNPIKKLRMGPVQRYLDVLIHKLRCVKIKEGCKVIYGHYCLDEFSHIVDPSTRRGAFFRTLILQRLLRATRRAARVMNPISRAKPTHPIVVARSNAIISRTSFEFVRRRSFTRPDSQSNVPS